MFWLSVFGADVRCINYTFNLTTMEKFKIKNAYYYNDFKAVIVMIQSPWATKSIDVYVQMPSPEIGNKGEDSKARSIILNYFTKAGVEIDNPNFTIYL